MSLAAKLAAVTAAITTIPKTGRNKAQDYAYVEDAAVLNIIRTELTKQGVATVANALEVDVMPYVSGKGNPGFLTTVKGNVMFIDAESGEELFASGIGQGSDPTDKGVYKALTGMFKYILLKTFLVPTGDDPESDDASAGGNKQAPPRDDFNDSAKPAGLTQKQRGLLMARFKAAGIADSERQAFTLKVTGKHSSTQLTGDDLDKVLTALDELPRAEQP